MPSITFARRYRHQLLLILAVAVFAGCGQTSTPTDGALGPTPATSSTPSPSSAAGPLELRQLGYLDNLVARDAAGEWTHIDGLNTTLGSFIGATSLRSVLLQPNLASYDLTGLLDEARTALNGDLGEAAETHLRNRLRFLLFDHDQLAGMVVDPTGPPPTGVRITPPPVLGPDETDIEEPTFDPASREYDTACELFFRRYPAAPGTTRCLVTDEGSSGSAQYTIYAPAPTIASFHWSDLHYAWVHEALEESITKLGHLGEVPDFDLVLGTNLDAPAEAATLLHEDRCVIVLYTHLQLRSEAVFKQVVARQLAHCVLAETLPDLVDTPYAERRWLQDGLATYMSSLVYPAADLESEALNVLLQIDDATGLMDWSSGSFVWHQFLDDRLGPAGVIEIARATKGMTTADQAAALADEPNVPELFHSFAVAYTDGTIEDASGGRLATAWQPDDSQEMQIQSSGNVMAVRIPPFGMSRSLFITPVNQGATIEYEQPSDSQTSARAYGGGGWGEAPTEFPGRCLDDNRLLILSTNTGARPMTRDTTVANLRPLC